MKKNLVLTIILAVLVGVAYQLEEVSKKETMKLNLLESRLLSKAKIISEIKTNNYHFIRKGDLWIEKSTAWRVDQEILNEFSNILKKIGIYSSVRKESNKTQDYFSSSSTVFEIKVDGKMKKFELGNVSKITGSFYIRDVDQPNLINICLDDSVLRVIHKTEVDLKLKKYQRLKNILSSSSINFLDRNLLSSLNLKMDDINSIKIKNRTAGWFELKVGENYTQPIAPKSINYHNFKEKVFGKTKNIKIEKIIKKAQNILSNPASEVIIEGRKNIKLRLYAALNGVYGSFLKISGQDQILKLDGDNADIFSSSIQDFWVKKIPFEVNFNNLKKLSFKLKKEGAKKFYPFEVNDLESFEVSSKDKEINFISKVHMNLLFNLLFNLADFKEATSIERLESSTPKSFTKKGIRVFIFEKKFQVWVEAGSIFVLDTKESLVFRFDNNKNQIPTDFFDKIFTVVKK